MEICDKKKAINTILLNIFLLFIFINFSYADIKFEHLEKKKVSYLDFFLLKLENKMTRRAQMLRSQIFASRVQYSTIGIKVEFDNEKNGIFIGIYAIMDKNRYKKKVYRQKLSDCNQVRNLIFYRKYGYKFLTQKRDPNLSKGTMIKIFKEVFFENLTFSEEEIEFLLNNMFIKVTILHPIRKNELICSGKINDYELK